VAPNQAEIHQRQAANYWGAMLEADAPRQENVRREVSHGQDYSIDNEKRGSCQRLVQHFY